MAALECSPLLPHCIVVVLCPFGGMGLYVGLVREWRSAHASGGGASMVWNVFPSLNNLPAVFTIFY